MKNPYIKYALQFFLIFLIGGAFFVAVGVEDTPPIWKRGMNIGDYIVEVLGFALVGMLVFALPILIKYWRARKKNPELSDLQSRFDDERDALNALANPHDPILNPQPSKKK